jgi:hypothetical protein
MVIEILLNCKHSSLGKKFNFCIVKMGKKNQRLIFLRYFTPLGLFVDIHFFVRL